jgi:glutamate synthase domain-containing protein 3
MKFSLSTPENTIKILSNASKIKVNLTNGIIEVLDKHQDLLGKVGIDIVQIESNNENKIEKFQFIVQEAIVIVSTKGLDSALAPDTGVYIYAQRVLELTSNLSLEEFSKKTEQSLAKLESEKQFLSTLDQEKEKQKARQLRTQIFRLEEEFLFNQAIVSLIKEGKN